MEKKIILLVCHVSALVGIGHLSRLLALAHFLRNSKKYNVEFLIFGEEFKTHELEFYNVFKEPISSDFDKSLKRIVKKVSPSMVIFDLYPKLLPPNFKGLLQWVQKRDIRIVGIDGLVDYCNFLDHLWMPTFYYDVNKTPKCLHKITSGWDTLLMQKRLPTKNWIPGNKVLILTGGSDSTNLGKVLPNLLDLSLRSGTIIDWVQGPFSKPPSIPKNPRLHWNIELSPSHLDELIVQSNYVLTIFGISFFEVLQYGLPAVVFSPYGKKDNEELEALSKEDVGLVKENLESAIEGIIELMDRDELAKKYSENSLRKLSINGASNLAKKLELIMGDS